MKTVTGYVKTNILGSKVKFQFEIEGDESRSEIEALALEALFECIEWDYSVEEACQRIADFAGLQLAGARDGNGHTS